MSASATAKKEHLARMQVRLKCEVRGPNTKWVKVKTYTVKKPRSARLGQQAGEHCRRGPGGLRNRNVTVRKKKPQMSAARAAALRKAQKQSKKRKQTKKTLRKGGLSN